VPPVSDDLRFRGLVHQVTDVEVEKRLDTERIVAYAGFDPTAPSLHIGSLLQLCTLRRLQEGGHRPVVLLGGGTGQIGDPGGKSAERPLRGRDELAANAAAIHQQVGRFVDVAPLGEDDGRRGIVLDNAQWLEPLGTLEFLREVGKHFTVNQMVTKESVRTRLDRPEQGISFTEFSYMLLQAYDFLRLHLDHGCELQFGGSDQWGNITLGVELVRKVRQRQVFGMTSPLVTKADGTKFGKTESGTLWLDAGMTSPFRLFQYLLQTEDAVVGRHLRALTFLSHEEILHLDSLTTAEPGRRAAQRALAQAVCTLVHGTEETERAQRASAALFGPELAELDEDLLVEVVSDAPSTTVPRPTLAEGALSVTDLLVRTGLARSRGEARRAVQQGGIAVNNLRIADPELRVGPPQLLHDRYLVLRRGKRSVHVVQVT